LNNGKVSKIHRGEIYIKKNGANSISINYKKFLNFVILIEASPLLRVDIIMNPVKKSSKSNSLSYYIELVF